MGPKSLDTMPVASKASSTNQPSDSPRLHVYYKRHKWRQCPDTYRVLGKQCAAVRTHHGWMMEPPHRCFPSIWILTCHGNSPFWTSSSSRNGNHDEFGKAGLWPHRTGFERESKETLVYETPREIPTSYSQNLSS